jgi:hypothetical protein
MPTPMRSSSIEPQPLNFRSDYAPASGTQTFVTITAVPEPATYAMALAGLGGVLAYRIMRVKTVNHRVHANRRGRV